MHADVTVCAARKDLGGTVPSQGKDFVLVCCLLSLELVERLLGLAHVVQADLAVEARSHEDIGCGRVDFYLRNATLVTLVRLDGLSLVLLPQIKNFDHAVFLAGHHKVARCIHRCHNLVVGKNGLLHRRVAQVDYLKLVVSSRGENTVRRRPLESCDAEAGIDTGSCLHTLDSRALALVRAFDRQIVAEPL